MAWGRRAPGVAGRRHATRGKVTWWWWVRIGHRGPREMMRRVDERVRRRERMGLYRARGWWVHCRIWRAWGRGWTRLCRGRRGRLALPGRAGGGLGHRGRIIAETERLERPWRLRLRRGVVENVGVGRRGLRRGLRLLLLLLLGRGLLVGGGWVS